MPSLGIEPATFAHEAQTLTQLTKWPGQASAFSSGALAKFPDAIQTIAKSLLSEPCATESGAPHFTDPDQPGRRRRPRKMKTETKMGEMEEMEIK